MPNNDQLPAAAWGLRLRPRDLAKFGLLYMNNGKWGNTQILDSDWVKQSLSAEVSRPSESPNIPRGYGFQFWTDLLIQRQYKTDIPWATGYGGQLIFFWRSMDILVVFTGWNDNPNDPNAIVAFYVNIVPSVKEMQPYFK